MKKPEGPPTWRVYMATVRTDENGYPCQINKTTMCPSERPVYDRATGGIKMIKCEPEADARAMEKELKRANPHATVFVLEPGDTDVPPIEPRKRVRGPDDPLRPRKRRPRPTPGLSRKRKRVVGSRRYMEELAHRQLTKS